MQISLLNIFLFNFSEAIETRHALHGIRWPTSNPKCLNVDFGTESLMEKAIASTVDDVKPNVSSRDDRIVSSNDLHDSARERVIIYSCAVLSCISFGFITRFYDFLIEIDG